MAQEQIPRATFDSVIGKLTLYGEIKDDKLQVWIGAEVFETNPEGSDELYPLFDLWSVIEDIFDCHRTYDGNGPLEYESAQALLSFSDRLREEVERVGIETAAAGNQRRGK
jgi:hypothetical protein